jgi:uncharacterized membrane protein YidH (DUF202 family)
VAILLAIIPYLLLLLRARPWHDWPAGGKVGHERRTDTKQSPLDTSTGLAYERIYLAHERTLMDWVRTAISLISFGFTIAKVFEYLREKNGERATLLGPRAIGIIMNATGLVALALATMQHRQGSKVLHGCVQRSAAEQEHHRCRWATQLRQTGSQFNHRGHMCRVFMNEELLNRRQQRRRVDVGSRV